MRYSLEGKHGLFPTSIALLCFLVGGCTVKQLPRQTVPSGVEGIEIVKPPDCPPLTEKGENGSVALFVTKGPQPFQVCVRLYNGLSFPIWNKPAELQPVNFSARLKRWWFCYQLGTGAVLLGSLGLARVDPGQSLLFFLQPSCQGEGQAIPGTYQVVASYEIPYPDGTSSTASAYSEMFQLP